MSLPAGRPSREITGEEGQERSMLENSNLLKTQCSEHRGFGLTGRLPPTLQVSTFFLRVHDKTLPPQLPILLSP